MAYGSDPIWDMCGSETTTCNMAWALVIHHSQNITILGAGLYSWFQNYNEDCVNSNSCQTRLVNIFNVASLILNHIITIGAVEIITPAISNTNNEILYASDHIQALEYPWWTAVATYFDSFSAFDVSAGTIPVKNGWVAFGDSYGAGIGAGAPYDSVPICRRGTGAYPTYLDTLITGQNQYLKTTFQFLACSGEKATDFFGGAGQQLNQYNPTNADIATISFFGNDLDFGAIVSTCIVGYTKNPTCDSLIARANSILDGDSIASTFHDVVTAIRTKAALSKPRLQIYWTGYPRFFDTTTTTCDSNRFWAGQYGWYYYGEYMTVDLRTRLNALSARLNDYLQDQIRRWNRQQTYPQITYIELDDTVYPGRRFCEPFVTEPREGASQAAVAFFYPRGADDVPTDVPPHAPYQGTSGSAWAVNTISSADCGNRPTEAWVGAEMALCEWAVAAAADPSIVPQLQQLFVLNGDNTTTVQIDGAGNVIITTTDIEYAKMYHPKSRANLGIARQIMGYLRTN